MKTCVFFLAILSHGLVAQATEDALQRYQISVDGPSGQFEARCDDPCEIDHTQDFGDSQLLSEGVALSIKDGKAKFAFHEVVVSERGETMNIQRSGFEIDRPLIEVELHGHDVVVVTSMDESDRTDRKITRKGIEIDN